MLRTVALVLLVAACAHAITFDLPSGRKKCLQEDVHKDVLVVGEYQLTDSDDIITDLQITDSRGHPVYRKDDATKGKFAFTSDDYDVFDICFSNKARQGRREDPNIKRRVTFTVKVGVEARSYEELAKAEKLKPMELELRKLEDLSESIVADFARMKEREEQHRDTNESTNERLLHFSIFSMVCLVVLALWQVLYLKRYFKQKKLI